MSFNRKKWTKEEENNLKEFYNNSRCFTDVANKLGRTVDAVQARYVKKYIITNNNKKNKEYFQKYYKNIAENHKIKDNDFIRYLKYNNITIDNNLKNLDEIKINDNKQFEIQTINLKILDEIKVKFNFNWFYFSTIAPSIITYFLCKAFKI